MSKYKRMSIVIPEEKRSEYKTIFRVQDQVKKYESFKI